MSRRTLISIVLPTLISIVLATTGLFLTGCGQQEQGQDAENTEETVSEGTTAEETLVKETTQQETTSTAATEEARRDTEETVSEGTTAGETLVKETTQQETTSTPTSDSEQASKAEVEAAPRAQAANPTPSNGESQPPDGFAPSQGLGANESEQAVSNPPSISPADSIVFLPIGNGVTYSCAGGPPFVHYGHDASMGNCAVQHVLPPVGLVCDIPTTMTIVHDMDQLVFDGGLCRSGTDASLASPEMPLPAQAQPSPFGTEPAPYSAHHQH